MTYLSNNVQVGLLLRCVMRMAGDSLLYGVEWRNEENCVAIKLQWRKRVGSNHDLVRELRLDWKNMAFHAFTPMTVWERLRLWWFCFTSWRRHDLGDDE